MMTPIIAISRGTFTGGQTLARCLADRLGYTYVGREEIVQAATWCGVSAEKIIDAMDKPPSLWDRITRARAAYLDSFRAALCERVQAGGVVYHGHIGHLLLPGVSHILRVRAVADLEYRIKAAMEQQHIGNRRDALAFIERVDRERVEWTRFLYGVDWDDPILYDLVVNLSRMSVDTACEMVVEVAELDAFRPTPQSMKALRDLGLRSRVSAVLATDPRTRVTGLTVEADDGIVTIKGVPRSQEITNAIRMVAGDVVGVREVRFQSADNPTYCDGSP